MQGRKPPMPAGGWGDNPPKPSWRKRKQANLDAEPLEEDAPEEQPAATRWLGPTPPRARRRERR
jgi:hypothetical protein